MKIFRYIGLLLLCFNYLNAQVPFECKGQYYLSLTRSGAQSSGLYEVKINPDGTKIFLDNISPSIGLVLNGMGYRITDDFIYGMDPNTAGTPEQTVFSGTKKIIEIRKKYSAFGDYNKIEWMSPHNIHIAGYIRYKEADRIFCLFNFSNQVEKITWYGFREKGCKQGLELHDLWSGTKYIVGNDNQHLDLKPYQFVILKEA